MAGGAQGLPIEGKEIREIAGWVEPGAAEAALGEGAEGLCLRRSPRGRKAWPDLFGTKSQLVVWHFMMGRPDWKEGCPGCSFWADSFNGNIIHMASRDITMMAISRASLKKIEPFKKRMGWNFKWVSSEKNDFNFDYQVSSTREELKKGEGGL